MFGLTKEKATPPAPKLVSVSSAPATDKSFYLVTMTVQVPTPTGPADPFAPLTASALRSGDDVAELVRADISRRGETARLTGVAGKEQREAEIESLEDQIRKYKKQLDDLGRPAPRDQADMLTAAIKELDRELVGAKKKLAAYAPPPFDAAAEEQSLLRAVPLAVELELERLRGIWAVRAADRAVRLAESEIYTSGRLKNGLDKRTIRKAQEKIEDLREAARDAGESLAAASLAAGDALPAAHRAIDILLTAERNRLGREMDTVAAPLLADLLPVAEMANAGSELATTDVRALFGRVVNAALKENPLPPEPVETYPQCSREFPKKPAKQKV